MQDPPDSSHIDRVAGEKNRSKVEISIAVFVVRKADLHLDDLGGLSQVQSTQDPSRD
jgi:hypothetical protein